MPVLGRQGTPILRTHAQKREYAQTAPCRVTIKAMASFRRGCWPLVDLYLGVFDWKAKILLAKRQIACVSDEL